MKSVILLFFCIIAVAHCSDIWEQIPGDDQTRMAALSKGVAVAKQIFYGHPCLHDYFAGFGDPQDTADLWVASICSLINPTAINTSIVTPGDCSYRNHNDTVEVVGELELAHQFGVTNTSYVLVRDLLVRAIQIAGGYDNAFVNLLRDDLDLELFDALVKTADKPCPTANYQVNWLNPTHPTLKIKPNEMVEFIWDDTATHNIEDTAASNPTIFYGFGGTGHTLASGDACTAAGASFPDGGTPCNLVGVNKKFSYAYRFVKEGVYKLRCNIHKTGMTAEITVTSAVDGSTDGGDGTDGDAAGDSTDGDAASTLSSFLF